MSISGTEKDFRHSSSETRRDSVVLMYEDLFNAA